MNTRLAWGFGKLNCAATAPTFLGLTFSMYNRVRPSGTGKVESVAIKETAKESVEQAVTSVC